MTSASQSWFSPPNRPGLNAGEVHIWHLSLDRPAPTVEKLREVLTPDEATRADRFHFEVDRRRFIVARANLRELLGAYLVIGPAEVQFSYSEHGKPSLPRSINRAGLTFNLAHSGNRALYALTLNRQIGVDLEHIRPEFAGDEIARRYFSPREVDRLGRLEADQRHRAFFNCWTRKEAFIKAYGTGLSLGLDQFEVTLAPDEPAALLATHWDQAEAARWSLRAVDAGPDYAAAVAVEGHEWVLRSWHCDGGSDPR